MFSIFIVDIRTVASLRIGTQYQTVFSIITESIGTAIRLFDAGAVAPLIIRITGNISFFIYLAVNFKIVCVLSKSGVPQRIFYLCDQMVRCVVVGGDLPQGVS